MRILEIETFGRGGLAHYVYNLSCALAERGHEVVLLTAAAYELEQRSRPPDLTVVKPIARRAGRIDKLKPAAVAALARKLEALTDAVVVGFRARRLRPDVVHLHCTNPIAFAYVAMLRILRLPVVTTAHVVTPHESTPLANRTFGRIHRASGSVIAHSEFDRRRLLEEFGLESERVEVIPHGEYGFFERAESSPSREAARDSFGLTADEEVALFFGYIREYKGLDLLLDAWPAVLEARPKARLLVAGDPVRLAPGRRRELQRQAERLGVTHHFGYVPFADVGRYYAAADALVMPYRHVSQSGVLYLALALGVPVLATRVGALPEVLQHGESALLVPPESPQTLAESLGRLLGDAGLRARLASGGRRIAERHSWPSIAARTESVFARHIAG